MKTAEIIKQVNESTCLKELSEVMNRIEAAIDTNAVDYDLRAWGDVLICVIDRVAELRQRVIH